MAIWPDEATRRRLSLLKLGAAPGLRLVKPEQWHITLRFLGEVDEDLVPALADALRCAADHTAGHVRGAFGPATAWFAGDRVLQIPVAGLDATAAAVRAATLPLVPDPGTGEQRFVGHLTIARTNKRRLPSSVRSALKGIPFAATFDIDHVDLVGSQPSPQGHRYATLARVPLPA